MQASNQIDENWELMKLGTLGTPTQSEWLNAHTPSDSKVGFYKYQLTMSIYNRMQSSLKHSRSLQMLDKCLVASVWPDRPPRPANPVIILPESFTGKSWKQKIDIVREKLLSENVCGLLISALDEIAWLFNLRGSDIPHNPVFFSFCFLTAKEIHIFFNKCSISNSPGLCEYLFDNSNCLNQSYMVTNLYFFLTVKLLHL